MTGGSLHILAWAAQASVGLALVAAAAFKVVDPFAFVGHVRRLGGLPERLTAPLAVAFVGGEAALGVALVVAWAADVVLPVGVGLLLALSVLTHWGAATGRVEDCGCYGGALELTPKQSLALDAAYVGLLVGAWSLTEPGRASGAWKPAAVVSIGVLAAWLTRRTLRSARLLYDVKPLKVGRRWRASWLEGYDLDANGEHLVAFMGPACPACPRWMPLLNAIHEHSDLPSVVAGLATAGEQALSYTREHELRFPVVSIPERTLKRLTRTVPTMVLVEHGLIRERWTGRMPKALEARVRDTLGPDIPVGALSGEEAPAAGHGAAPSGSAPVEDVRP